MRQTRGNDTDINKYHYSVHGGRFHDQCGARLGLPQLIIDTHAWKAGIQQALESKCFVFVSRVAHQHQSTFKRCIKVSTLLP